MTPQDKAYKDWKARAQVWPLVDWKDIHGHESVFKAGFEAGARYAFDTMADVLVKPPDNGSEP